jgi:hypothetical protein
LADLEKIFTNDPLIKFSKASVEELPEAPDVQEVSALQEGHILPQNDLLPLLEPGIPQHHVIETYEDQLRALYVSNPMKPKPFMEWLKRQDDYTALEQKLGIAFIEAKIKSYRKKVTSKSVPHQ